jgi:hypothetical protein
MTQLELLSKINHLPSELKSEVNDFVDFLLSKKGKKSSKKQPVFGSANGDIYISPDFDEPLSDFKDYM